MIDTSGIRLNREQIWRKPSGEIRGLTRRKGTLQPAGHILCVESETRILHDVLWTLYQPVLKNPDAITWAKPAAAELLTHFSRRMSGWYQLEEISKCIASARDLINSANTAEDYLAVMEETMLYVGRVNMWVDLQVPWYDLNRVVAKRKR
jgi:hypothetical protein